MDAHFRNRRQAGRFLADQLAAYQWRPNVLVLGLPRGGVPVAFEVARALRVPLGVFLVRKLGAPGNEEFAVGAIAAGGLQLVNWETVEALGVSQEAIDALIQREERELARRERLYGTDRPRFSVADREVILVDDGLATGATMLVAVAALRQQHPARIVIGVPIAAPATCHELAAVADDIVCAMTPEPLSSVGAWYEDFSPTTDEEVRELLEIAARDHSSEERLGADGTTAPTPVSQQRP